MSAPFPLAAMAKTTAWVWLASALPAASPPDAGVDDCAQVVAAAPDFALEDVNPTSATFGQVVPRTAASGQVTLLYFALPSCGHCQADVDQLGALVEEQGSAWSEVSVRVVALNAATEDLPILADGHDLPILLDEAERTVERAYGAERWYIYLLDRSGAPRIIHYSLDFSRERERLVAEVAALLTEAAP